MAPKKRTSAYAKATFLHQQFHAGVMDARQVFYDLVAYIAATTPATREEVLVYAKRTSRAVAFHERLKLKDRAQFCQWVRGTKGGIKARHIAKKSKPQNQISLC